VREEEERDYAVSRTFNKNIRWRRRRLRDRPDGYPLKPGENLDSGNFSNFASYMGGDFWRRVAGEREKIRREKEKRVNR